MAVSKADSCGESVLLNGLTFISMKVRHFLGSRQMSNAGEMKKLYSLFARLFQQTKPPQRLQEALPAEPLPPPAVINMASLLGDTITAVTIFHEDHGENGWLDYSISYLTLQKNGIIHFPSPPAGSMEIENVVPDARARDISQKIKPYIIGQPIAELYYKFHEADDPDWDEVAFIELGNGYVIHERRMAPKGTGAANLFLYSREQFQEKKNSADYQLVALTSILRNSIYG